VTSGAQHASLTILLFAQSREAAGTDRLTLPWDGGDVAALRLAIGDHHPALSALMSSCAVAVNQRVVGPEAQVAPGDEVALLPPFGGG
jgi:molybdopterin converting factor subunit 1